MRHSAWTIPFRDVAPARETSASGLVGLSGPDSVNFDSSRKQSAAQSNEERISAIVEPTEWIKLIRPTMCRLVAENESSILLYHSLDNGMVWHAEDPQSLEFPLVSKAYS